MSTRIELDVTPGRIARMHATGLLRARPLAPRDGIVRIALVQTAASLLSGDRVRIDVRAGDGARLELVEVAGLIAQNVRGGAPARYDVRLELSAGARVHWAGQPLVLAAGCDLLRTVTVDLGPDAALLQRDTVVLGRAGEQPGALRSALDVRGVHVEELDTSDLGLLRSPVVAGDAKVLDTLALYGCRADEPAALQLAAAGTVMPACAPSLAISERVLGPMTERWWRSLDAEEPVASVQPSPLAAPAR